MTRYILRDAVCLVLLLTAALPASAQVPMGSPPPPMPPSAPPEPIKLVPGPAGVAAMVNGQKILISQVNALAAPRMTDFRKQIESQATDLIINNTLVDQAAKEQHITATAAEINDHIADVRKQLASDPRAQGMTLEALLVRNHESMSDFKDSLRLRVEAEKILAHTVTPIVMVHARHILVLTDNPNGSPDMKPHTDDDAKKIIAKAAADLKSGKSFDAVAKMYSEDPSTKDKGGDLGIIGTGQSYDPAFLAAALALKSGQVTATPVKSIYGYHLIKVDSTNSDPTPADKAALTAAVEQARQQQIQQAIPGYVQSLRQHAKVVMYVIP